MDEQSLASRLASFLNLPPGAMAAATARQAALGGALDTSLLEGGTVDEPSLLAALAACHGLPAAGRAEIDAVGAHLPRLFPRAFVDAHGLVPAGLTDQVLAVFCLAPPDPARVARVRARLNLTLAPLVTSELRLQYAMRRLYGAAVSPRFRDLLARLDGAPAGAAEVGHGQDVRALLAQLDGADDRDAIIAILMDFAHSTFSFAALFVVHGGAAVGWRGHDPAATALIEGLRLPLNQPSVFQTIYATRGHYLGPLPDNRANAAVLAALGRAPPRTAFLAPLVVGDRLAAILYADHGARPVGPARVAVLLALLQRSTLLLEGLVRRRRATLAHAAAPAGPSVMARGEPAAVGADGDRAAWTAELRAPLAPGPAEPEGESWGATPRPAMAAQTADAEGQTWHAEPQPGSASGHSGVPAAGAAAAAREMADEARSRWLDALDRAGPEARRGILARLLPLGTTLDDEIAARFPGTLCFAPLSHPGRPPPFARCSGLTALIAARGPTAADVVQGMLAADEPSTRYMAIYYFVAFPRPAAVVPLARRLYDVEPRNRQLAVEALRRITAAPGYVEVVRGLLEQLALPTPTARVAAAQILGQLREPAAVPALIARVDAREQAVADSACAALALICGQALGHDRERWEAWWHAHAGLPRAAWLTAGLSLPNATIRQVAAGELALLAATPTRAEAAGAALTPARRERLEGVEADVGSPGGAL